MAHSRMNIYISVVKGRSILAALAALLALLGLITLGHEIAVCVLNVQEIGYAVTTAQIIATVAALLAAVAGFVAASPARITAELQTLRRSFIFAAVLSLIALAFLITTLVLFAPYMWNIWNEANNTILEPHGPYMFGHADIGTSTYFQLPPTANPSSFVNSRPRHNYYYYVRVIAILKLVAMIADSILTGAAFVTLILCVVNIFSLRSSHVPLPGHEVVHVHGGQHDVYYENARRS